MPPDQWAFVIIANVIYCLFWATNAWEQYIKRCEHREWVNRWPELRR